jgi:predicted AAA+ superfamily ATPase
VYKTFKSRGETVDRNSLYDYLEYFEEAYLICPIPIFELSTRKRQVNPSKIYCIDTGMIHGYSIKPQMEAGACLENAVYIQLRRLEYDNIYYYKTPMGKEVDFIAQRQNGLIDLYQVCVSISDEKTKERELAALIEAAKVLKQDRVFLITKDDSETINLENLTVHVIPYWQWAIH